MCCLTIVKQDSVDMQDELVTLTHAAPGRGDEQRDEGLNQTHPHRPPRTRAGGLRPRRHQRSPRRRSERLRYRRSHPHAKARVVFAVSCGSGDQSWPHTGSAGFRTQSELLRTARHPHERSRLVAALRPIKSIQKDSTHVFDVFAIGGATLRAC